MGMIGQTLSHYRIEEKIGAGGMGVVYRAHDEQLDRDVAIKVLPPGSLGDEAARRRFRKEALSLARLNHPNIATVHEFGSQDGADFLVTEYIAGTTVDAMLANGALPVAEVVRLGVQLARGLAAAHLQGVVHRDLKPGNLRLTADGRLKILDFGLAQFIARPSEMGMTVTMTKVEETSGTLPYMAPEQLKGEVADVRSDIWAAGAVLYEMATGKRPFVQPTPALLINAILNQFPEPPSAKNPAVPALLDAVILKTLAQEPAKRYQSADELASELESPTALTSAFIPIQRKPRSDRWMFAAGAAVVLLMVGAFFGLRHRNSVNSAPLTPNASTVNRRRSVAVMGFKNLSANPEKSWLSTAISEMLTTELSQGDQLRTIPGESIAQMKAGLALPDSESFSRETLNRIRQNLGSDDVVVGSYLALGNSLMRLDVRLQDAVSGETLASVSEKGNETEIDSLVSKAGAELRGKLGVGVLSDAQSAMVRASLPANPEAARLYSQGLQKLRVFDSRSARELLEKAAALDPNHAATHAALAESLSTLGYDEKAKQQAKRALALSTQSSREEKLLIEGRSHQILTELPQAIDSFRALWEFFPDNADYGLFLIRAQVAGGHGNDAKNTLADLRKLNVSDADAGRIDIAEAGIAASLGDFKQQQALAERAAVRGQTVGANLLVAQALQIEAVASERMGESKKTIDLANQARDLFVSAGDRRGAASSVLIVGDQLSDTGDYEGAKKQFEAALAVFREIGSRKGIRSSLDRIGNVFYAEGNMQESKKYYEELLRFDQELADPNALAGDYGNLANSLDGLGDLEGALKMQLKSLAAFNEIGDRRGASATLNNLGNLFVEKGDPEEAKKYFGQALDMTRATAFKRGEPYPIVGLGDALVAQGDLAGATKQYEQAMALCKEMNDEDLMAQINVSLAAIALAQKRYAVGADLARQAMTAYEKSNSTGNEAWSQAILARNLLGSGDLAGGKAAADKAIALSGQNTTGQTPRFEAALASSRVKAKSGKTEEALKELESTLASARKSGYRLFELQTQLAMAEVQLTAGSKAARTELAAVEKDARAAGALLVASQAKALLQADVPAKAH
jgi:eukaryotic-like serine/threonine-protein kinase